MPDRPAPADLARLRFARRRASLGGVARVSIAPIDDRRRPFYLHYDQRDTLPLRATIARARSAKES